MRDPGILDPRHFFFPRHFYTIYAIFTRFTRFLHDFMWFLHNFTRFLRFLHDFTRFLRNFTWFLHDLTRFLRFSRYFLPGKKFSIPGTKNYFQGLMPWEQTKGLSPVDIQCNTLSRNDYVACRIPIWPLRTISRRVQKVPRIENASNFQRLLMRLPKLSLQSHYVRKGGRQRDFASCKAHL